MEILYPVSAGIDVHRDTVVVSIRKRDGRGREPTETRTFETFNDALITMAKWLDEHHVPVVGLESTGVYWKPVVTVLRQQSPDRIIWLVNPAEVKKVPGRKTDVNDSQWLSKLVMHGLVSPSFLPSVQLEELRVLTRYRTRLTSEQTSCKNRILKVLEACGIKLASVCSNVFGKTGRALLDRIVQNPAGPIEVQDVAKGELRKKTGLLRRAVQGSLSDSNVFVLENLMAHLDKLAEQLGALDTKINKLLEAHEREDALLRSIPGLDRIGGARVLAEIGPDMSVFRNADALSAWSGLAPGSHESAGKSQSSSDAQRRQVPAHRPGPSGVVRSPSQGDALATKVSSARRAPRSQESNREHRAPHARRHLLHPSRRHSVSAAAAVNSSAQSHTPNRSTLH